MALSVDKLCAGYGQDLVLNDVSLDLQRGEWLTLLGPNGVGKSTLLHCIVGQIAPRSGAIHVSGYALANDRPEAMRCFGYACPPESLPDLLTGRQCLEVYAAAKELDCIDSSVLELAAALKFTPYLNNFVDTYSLGTRQKLSILLALLGNPPLLVLDEAFNGLDPASSLVLKRYLRASVSANHCAVLLATHSLDIAEHFSDKIALLLNGRLACVWDQDKLRAIKQTSSLEIELAAAAEG